MLWPWREPLLLSALVPGPREAALLGALAQEEERGGVCSLLT